MKTSDIDIMTADRQSFLREWQTSRSELHNAIIDLSEADLEKNGMTGEWNGRMTLVHIARWDEVTTEMIVRNHLGILSEVNEYDDYEWWNQRWAELDAGIPLETAWQRYHSSHEAIVRTMMALPDTSWNAYVRGWVREASVNHYRHHAETILRWRKEQGI